MECKNASVGQRVMIWQPDMAKDDFGTVVAPDAWNDGTQIRVKFDDGTIEEINATSLTPLLESDN